MCIASLRSAFFLFFFNDTATTEIYTLSLHDALPIYHPPIRLLTTRRKCFATLVLGRALWPADGDRKSTRLNSSHSQISYAVFCLKKKRSRGRARGVSGWRQARAGPCRPKPPARRAGR